MATAKIGRKELLDKIDDKLTWLLSERSRRREEFLCEWTKPIPTWRPGHYIIRTKDDAERLPYYNYSYTPNPYRAAQEYGRPMQEKLEKLRKLAEVAHGYVTLSQDEAGWLT